ncbi:MAG: RraA family protein [Methylobacteriaceae bacterium]|jgi:regulator of RNase E activity RraA|nr:RraA family protein [Methylobacteriaceae bacterium]
MDEGTRSEWLGLQTALVCDVMDAMGYRHQILPWEIQSLVLGTKLFGPAFTVLGRMAVDDSENDNSIRVEMLRQIPEGSVAVMSAADSRDSAHWGEITALAARNNGCIGAVVDGGTRDVAKLLEYGFPVFARFRSPAGSTGRWSVKCWQVPIRVEDVSIRPGDYIFGDEDGVVVVPKEILSETLKLAVEKRDKEAGMRKALAAGVTIDKVFKDFGHF